MTASLDEVQHRQVYLDVLVALLGHLLLPLDERILDLGGEVLGAQGVDDLQSQVKTRLVVRSSRGVWCTTYIEEVRPADRSTLILALGVRKVDPGGRICDGSSVELVAVELLELGNPHPTNLRHRQETLLPP